MHVTAATLAQLFADAGRGVASLIIENPDTIELRQTVTIDLEAEHVEGLFVDWLRELIYRFETDDLLCREFSIQLNDANRRLRAECRGERVVWLKACEVSSFDSTGHCKKRRRVWLRKRRRSRDVKSVDWRVANPSLNRSA